MTTVGSGRYRYERVAGWPTMPADWTFGHPGAAAVNSRDEVYVSGEFLQTWGAGARPDAGRPRFVPGRTRRHLRG